jgi:hypothetical protein
MMQFIGAIILFLAFFGLSDSFTLEGVLWFTIGLCFVAPHVVYDLIKEITHRVK